MAEPWHYYFMACLYILAGILHFILPGMYQRILPPWIPRGRFIVFITGVLEVALGVSLFFPVLKTAALYGIMVLLVMFLPVHTHMLKDSRAAMGIPLWILYLRIPLQGLLIYWGYSYL